ncbi:LOW QUALITY PROTEIN: hypothetical protein ACHAW6_002630 [Cyclotella cf. meneghiniana]
MFVSKTWAQIGNMDELSVFRLSFPEEFITDALIPATNKHIKGGALTLILYCMGCHFFMACFYGISDFHLWWSKNQFICLEAHPFISMTSSAAITLLQLQKLSGIPNRNLLEISMTGFMKCVTSLMVLMTITRQLTFLHGSIALMSS